jgi:hypothetical protein
MGVLKLYLNNAAAGYDPDATKGTWSDGTPLVVKKCSTSKDVSGSPASGSNNYGRRESETLLLFGTGDFTVEAWVQVDTPSAALPNVALALGTADNIGPNSFIDNFIYAPVGTDVCYYRGAFETVAEFNAENGHNSDVISGNTMTATLKVGVWK